MNITPINFDDKETYLKYRREWKAEYQELSEQIRHARAKLKEAQRKGGASWDRWALVLQLKRDARHRMEHLEKVKAIVRQRLRSLGFKAPEPKVREKPAPREKHKWTAEEIAEARYCFEVKAADGHSD